jgi:hypothetical protein
MTRIERSRWGWLVLFASSTTLVCCALPILLVSIGLGAASAALFSNFPFLAALAHHKVWLFAGSGAMLTAAGWALLRPGRACPADPDLAAKCAAAHRRNTRLFALSIAIWALGFAAAYLSLPLLDLYERLFSR